MKKRNEKADEERTVIRGELPPIEEIIKNFKEAEKEPAQDFIMRKGLCCEKKPDMK